jgi:hypothetical protein
LSANSFDNKNIANGFTSSDRSIVNPLFSDKKFQKSENDKVDEKHKPRGLWYQSTGDLM